MGMLPERGRFASVGQSVKRFSITIQSAIAAILLTAVVAVLLYLPYFSDLEDATSDHMIALRHWIDKMNGSHEPDKRIVMASIDERTVQQLGTWPLPRLDHGQFLAVLAPEKPKVVAWDVLFTEHSGLATTNPGGAPGLSDDDAGFVQGVGMIPNLITGAKSGDGVGAPLTDLKALLPTRPITNVTGDVRKLFSSPDAVLPFPELRKESYFGFVNDAGRVRRTMPLIVSVNGHIFPSFDTQILLLYWGIDPARVKVDVGHYIAFPMPNGKVLKVPINEEGCLVLNYRGTLEDFHAMSFNQMGKGLADKGNNVASNERNHLPDMKENIVIVGVTVVGTDAGVTPLDEASPLVVTHLNVLSNILQNDFLRTIGGYWMPFYAVFIFFFANRMLRLKVIPMLGVDILALALFAIIAFCLLLWDDMLVPVAMPEIGIILLGILVPARGFFGEEREKAKIKGIMQAYLSDKVMQKILEHPDNLKLGGVKVEITIMFCDIRGFTAYCDQRDPAETMDVLNEYMETMTQVVFDHEGTIDKYIGDCIMAFWNAPEPQPDHAERAVRCAMEMRNALGRFKARQHKVELQAFECGIGLHTGEALVGNMGSSLKRNYTAMGSTVNLGSRLESLTKRMKEHILVSEDTFKRLPEGLPLIDRGEEMVAGVALPVHVYAVVTPEEFVARQQRLEATPVPVS